MWPSCRESVVVVVVVLMVMLRLEVEVYRGRYNVFLGMTVVGPKMGMANMASVDARPSTPLHPCWWGEVPSEPGQKMLRIELQKGRGSTTMRQGSQNLGRSLTLETLDDESGMSSFGLGGPDEARRGGQGFGRRHGQGRRWTMGGSPSGWAHFSSPQISVPCETERQR